MDDGDQMSAFHRSHAGKLELPAHSPAYQLYLKYLVSIQEQQIYVQVMMAF